MACLNKKTVQYVEKGRLMVSPVHIVFELTGLESGGIDELCVVASAMPIRKQR